MHMDIFDTFLNAEVMRRTFPMLLQGLWITLQLGAASIVAGLVLGLGLAMARLYGSHGPAGAKPRIMPSSAGRVIFPPKALGPMIFTSEMTAWTRQVSTACFNALAMASKYW